MCPHYPVKYLTIHEETSYFGVRMMRADARPGSGWYWQLRGSEICHGPFESRRSAFWDYMNDIVQIPGSCGRTHYVERWFSWLLLAGFLFVMVGLLMR